MHFPNVDPIPIPAPVWLMKALGLLTLALHFFAVQILIGSLVAVAAFSYLGKNKRDSSSATAAAVISRRLPIVMTYVINLGIPPLLFAQVLYGRALYTSSVLIAVMWISVVFLLIPCYWLLYKIHEGASAGKSVVLITLIALGIAGTIGQIYSINMTLMLRPEVWAEMYSKTASGLQLAPKDPTMLPRWAFMMVGGLIGGGLWIALHSNLKGLESGTQTQLRKWGSGFAILGVVVQLVIGFWVRTSQPENVQASLGQNVVYSVSFLIWLVGAVLVLALSGAQFTRKTPSLFLGWAAPVGLFLSIAGYVLYRDGIRDITLMAKGFNVWDRAEHSNWFVISLFLLLFVIGLGIIGWLLSVMKQAQSITEEVQA